MILTKYCMRRVMGIYLHYCWEGGQKLHGSVKKHFCHTPSRKNASTQYT